MIAHGLSAPSADIRYRDGSGVHTFCAFATTVLLLLSGCGKSTSNTGAAPIASHPDVTVDFDGKRRKCIVSLPNEAQGSIISCEEVVSFIKGELRVPRNAVYDVRTIPQSDSDAYRAEIAKVRANLDSAGYRFMGAPSE